jgi:ferritin-like metal-binding protein YciE
LSRLCGSISSRLAMFAPADALRGGNVGPHRAFPVLRRNFGRGSHVGIARDTSSHRARRVSPPNQTEEPMGLFTKDIKSMDDLFIHVLQDIYYAENRIVKSLPEMIDKATNRDLTAALKNHLGETEKQVERLERAFELLGKKPQGTKCPAIDGIIQEADDIAGEVANKRVLDAALIAAAQAVEHYEITRYGTLIAWAEELGRDAVAKLLHATLNEEKAADKKLSAIAEMNVNLKAAS